MEKKNFRDVLEGAIYREIGARDFYKRLSESISNEEGKKKFFQLSQDEDGHREKLEGWYEKKFDEKFVFNSGAAKKSEMPVLDVKDQTSAIEALNIAIEAEARAEEFYRNEAKEVSEPELKELLTDLADQELGHYNLLLAERNSLVGGFYWFDMDSSAFLED